MLGSVTHRNRVLDTVKYGEELRLPEPFGITLDTGAFPLG
jgi:hypothetical protein